MIKFFRKIRQRLIRENRFTRYMLYALGEIVLVVVGILIALQINNWNQDRRERVLEDQYLKQIHKEFSNNKEQFEIVLSMHRKCYESCLWLMANYQNPEVNKDTLRKHLNLYRWSFTYNPSNSSVNAILNSGNIGIIKDKELSDELVRWNEMVNDYVEEEQYSREFFDEVIVPFEIKHFDIYTKPKQKRFDKFFEFNAATLNEFLNLVAVKKRLLWQIVHNPQEEYAQVSKSLDLIIRKTAIDD